MRVPRKYVFGVVTLLILVGVPLGAAEGMLRLFDRGAPIVSGWRFAENDRNRFQHNQLGFRGREFGYEEDDFVVLLVGDSHVEAVACSYYWMPERRLEHHLGDHVRVFSLAAGGYGQDQQLLALREYFNRFRADLVIVWETPSNDLWNNTFPTADAAGTQPKPTFWVENGRLRGPNARTGEVISSPSRLVTAFQRRLPPWDADWERRLPQPFEALREYSGPVNTTWQDLWDEGVGAFRTDNLENEKNHEAIYLTPRSPRMQYSIDLTHRLLQEMASLASARGGGFMTFWMDVPRLDIPEAEAVYGLNGRYYPVSKRQMLANMGDVNLGFDSYTAPIDFPDWRVSPTDGHLNEHATDIVMRDLARVVTARYGDRIAARRGVAGGRTREGNSRSPAT